MKNFIPTYEQCREICDANDNFTFYETKHNVDGYNISIFNYRLAMPPLFYKPIPSNTEIVAHELRGLTFVFNKDGSLYNKYILMDKFFNLNQSECSTYSLMKKEVIKEIAYKEDGSIASFVKLPNNRIIGRSKASFESDQAIEVEKIYNENKDIKRLVDICFNYGIIPIFEYVSPRNRVVLQYAKTDLVLIKLRINKTGEYISVEDLKALTEKNILDGITIVKTFNDLSLDDLIAKCEVDTGYEGFVITFESGKMVKLKLLEYINLHNLHTEDLHREDSIIYLIINEKIDDILCQLADDDERKLMVLEIIELVNRSIIFEYNSIKNLLSKYNGSKKDFALSYIKDEYFPYAMMHINRDIDIISIAKDKILKDTSKLMEARDWVDKNKKLYNVI